MNEIILFSGILLVICVGWGLLLWFVFKKFLQIITELTNKLMSKNYGDYALTKSYETTPSEETTRQRTDEDEALIEIAKQKITENVKLADEMDRLAGK